MNTHLAQELQKFLKKHLKKGQTLLLGFSGGADSLALLHLLLQWKEYYAIDLHLAHVDHGWRKESFEEAKALQQMAHSLGLPFHLERLEGEVKGNLELYAREKRYAFFLKVYKEIRADSLLLAHHADDQAETVLKRIFEGSSLFSLGGLKKISTFQGMVVWRPLLGINKKALLHWLAVKKLTPIDDYTNKDPQYLRARMRVDILPQLAETFGKEISSNLFQLGESAQQLKDYLQRKVSPYIVGALRLGPEGKIWDLNPFFPMEELEIEALIKLLCEQEELSLSREERHLMKDLIQKNRGTKKISLKNGFFIVDKRVVLLKREIHEINQISN